MKRFFASILLSTLVSAGGLNVMNEAQALNLSDLVKKPTQLYLPSQIIPGHDAVFTVKGKPGQQVKIILSSENSGQSLPNGVALRVGEPTLTESVEIPASGVAEITIKIPEDVDALGTEQFVEALVSPPTDENAAEAAQIINSSGTVASQNIIAVVGEPDKGSTMIIPGDPNMAGLLRSINTMTDVQGDERKKQLLYDGTINRERQIDRTYTQNGP